MTSCNVGSVLCRAKSSIWLRIPLRDSPFIVYLPFHEPLLVAKHLRSL